MASSACSEPCEFYVRQLVSEATLTPEAVVPPVSDTAVAWASVFINERPSDAWFTARVIAAPPAFACCDFQATSPTIDVDGVTAVHVHEGRPGVNGAILMTLSRQMLADTSLVPYYLADDGGTFAPDRYDIFATGGAYVDVHTASFPDGQVRGQIEPLVYDRSFRCVRAD